MLKKISNYFSENIRFKNLFRVSNIFLLMLIYIVAISCIILSSARFSGNFWHKLVNKQFSNTRLAIYGVDDRIGEVMLYNKIIKVLKSSEIDYVGIKFPEYYTNFWLTKHFYEVAASLVNYFFEPQLNIAVTHYVKAMPMGYNIVYLNVPNDMLYTTEGKFKEQYSHLSNYDAYIDVYSVLHGHNEALQEALKCHKCYEQKPRKIVPAFLAHEYVDYKAAESFDKAVVTGSIWGCSRNSLRFANAMKKLGQDDLLIAYGLKEHLKFLNKAYKGSIGEENKKSPTEEIFEIHNKHGISLIAHNLEHMIEGIPTNRILEAVASGAIVITDENLFIKKFFGDTVLYFDIMTDSNQIYDQISNHIEWIKDNPEEVKKRAKAAYAIFSNNFTIEKQLENIINQLSVMAN